MTIDECRMANEGILSILKSFQKTERSDFHKSSIFNLHSSILLMAAGLSILDLGFRILD
jgi:hypothetical protein